MWSCLRFRWKMVLLLIYGMYMILKSIYFLIVRVEIILGWEFFKEVGRN